MFDIQIRSEIPHPRLRLSFFKATVRKILKTLKWEKASLSILLVDDFKMRRFNQRYFNRRRTTDVIAFPNLCHNKKRRKCQSGIKKEVPFLGDILVSIPTARRQAKAYGNLLQYEVCLYLCHGILHLLGNKDKTKREFLAMEKKQKKILEKIGIKRC